MPLSPKVSSDSSSMGPVIVDQNAPLMAQSEKELTDMYRTQLRLSQAELAPTLFGMLEFNVPGYGAPFTQALSYVDPEEHDDISSTGIWHFKRIFAEYGVSLDDVHRFRTALEEVTNAEEKLAEFFYTMRIHQLWLEEFFTIVNGYNITDLNNPAGIEPLA